MTRAFYHLSDRRILRIDGGDAFSFLQNVMTNDMNRVVEQGIVYACLLTPQGQWLYDFFIMPDANGGFIADVERDGYDDLLRRLTMFKLRAKVTLTTDENIHVYGSAQNQKDIKGFQDPRLPTLGYRLYAGKPLENAMPVSAYDDMCISLGVPCGGKAILRGRDVMADVNLDLLNAVAWDKGCFIGQEVAARMHHRNLMKRRLMQVAGEILEAGAILRRAEGEVGQIRQVSTDGKTALAVVKLAVLAEPKLPVTLQNGQSVDIHPPAYIRQY